MKLLIDFVNGGPPPHVLVRDEDTGMDITPYVHRLIVSYSEADGVRYSIELKPLSGEAHGVLTLPNGTLELPHGTLSDGTLGLPRGSEVK